MKRGNKLFLFLERLSIAHGLSRACECQVLSDFDLKSPVLDLGCGDGIFAQICFGKGRIEVGLDKDKNEVRKARDRGVYQKVILADIACLPFPSEKFATVVSNCTFEHIKEIDKALAEASRVLKKRGQIIFTVPAPWLREYFFFSQILAKLGLKGLAERYSSFKNRLWQHVHLHGQAWWERKLKKAGFHQVRSYSFAEAKIAAICDFLSIFSLPWWFLKKFNLSWQFPRPRFLIRILLALTENLTLGKTERGASFVFKAVKK